MDTEKHNNENHVPSPSISSAEFCFLEQYEASLDSLPRILNWIIVVVLVELLWRCVYGTCVRMQGA